MSEATTIAAISGLIGAVLGAGGITPIMIAYTNHKRQSFIDAQHAMSEMFVHLRDRIEAVEAAEKECIKAKEDLLIEMGSLRKELELIRTKFKD